MCDSLVEPRNGHGQHEPRDGHGDREAQDHAGDDTKPHDHAGHDTEQHRTHAPRRSAHSGHHAGASIADRVRDIRNRFLVAAALTVPILQSEDAPHDGGGRPPGAATT